MGHTFVRIHSKDLPGGLDQFEFELLVAVLYHAVFNFLLHGFLDLGTPLPNFLLQPQNHLLHLQSVLDADLRVFLDRGVEVLSRRHGAGPGRQRILVVHAAGL